MPGGNWRYITWLEMVQTAMVNWGSTKRNKHEFIDVGSTPYFLFPANTTFDNTTPSVAKTLLYQWAATLNKQLPQQHPVHVLDAEISNQARSVSGVVFHSQAKDMGFLVTAQPVADLNFGDTTVCGTLINDYATSYAARFGINWETKFALAANCNFTDNIPVTQFFYNNQTKAANVEMLSTTSPTYTHRTIAHRSPTKAFCLQNIDRPVIVQKTKTGLNLELYY